MGVLFQCPLQIFGQCVRGRLGKLDEEAVPPPRSVGVGASRAKAGCRPCRPKRSRRTDATNPSLSFSPNRSEIPPSRPTKNVELWSFTVNLAVEADFKALTATRALDALVTGKVEGDDPASPHELAQKRPGPRVLYMRRVRQVYVEMLLTRVVDNFLKYVVDIIREVLRKQPAILRSRQQSVTIEQLLEYSSIEALVDDLIESKVNSLSYDGFEALAQWCGAKGIPMPLRHCLKATPAGDRCPPTRSTSESTPRHRVPGRRCCLPGK